MPVNAKPFDLSAIRLLPGPFCDNMQRGRTYLLNLDADRLLHNFRITAGLPSTAEPLGGWESPQCELRGHTLGHFLSALAMMYASTGEGILKEKVDYIVNELAKCQAAMPTQGFKSGYLSAYSEKSFDRWQQHRGVWAPYYVLHKIMAGLLDAYRHCQNQEALEVLLQLGEWLKHRIEPLSDVLVQIALTCEPGGISEVLADLYEVTGDASYLKLSLKFNHQVLIESLARGEDCLDGLHANTQIPKVVGAARQYELVGNQQLRNCAEYFWHIVATQRSWAIGGNSEEEFFFPPSESSQHLTALTAETCNTYNMLRLTRQLFAWQPSAHYMDFYERALFNHILGSQDPDSGQMIYFASLRPGHFKVYSTPHDTFWCCTGTGMESHAKYGDTIYSYNHDSLYINLFIASELCWKEKGIVLRQRTKFPDEEKSTFELQCATPTSLTLKIRRPGWAGDGFAITINGEMQELESVPATYITIERVWNTDDTIEVSLPMQLYCEALPDDPNTVAVLSGPIVLAMELGTEDLPSDGEQAAGTDHHTYCNQRTPAVPKLIVKSVEEVLRRLVRVKSSELRFKTHGLCHPQDVTLIPFFRVHHQRYTVYMEW